MGWIADTAKLPFKIPGAVWRNSPKGVKNFAIGSLIAGGVGGLIAYDAVRTRPGKHFDADDVALKPIPQLLTPEDLMMQPMPQEMAGPADGRGEFEFRNRVLAGRGQALEQPAMNAVQPRMSAIDPDAVRDLGAAKTTQAV